MNQKHKELFEKKNPANQHLYIYTYFSNLCSISFPLCEVQGIISFLYKIAGPFSLCTGFECDVGVVLTKTGH